MDTTTSDAGAQAEPETNGAVIEPAGHNADQVITTDESGTPTLAPLASTSAEAGEPETGEVETIETPVVTEEPQAEIPAADKTDDEITQWSQSKGITINPENANEIKLARMQLAAERKMHEANQLKVHTPPPEELPLTGDPVTDHIVERLNRSDQMQYVQNWFMVHPEMAQHKAELQQIAINRPYLTDMDDVAAHFLANPNRESDLKKQGGKEALTNLAQKQQAIPPSAGATNSNVYEQSTINPTNVYDLVDRNDQAWFEKHHDEISRAMAGK